VLADVAVPTWAAWTAGITAVCTAVAAVAGGARVVLSFIRWIVAIDESLPVLVDLARNYSDEHGGEALTAELAGLARNQGLVAENQGLIATKLDVHSAKLDAGLAKLDELHAYSHAMKHDIIGDVGVLAATMGTTVTIVDALQHTADELRAVREALQQHDEDAP
jgi:hypothetical protein